MYCFDGFGTELAAAKVIFGHSNSVKKSGFARVSGLDLDQLMRRICELQDFRLVDITEEFFCDR